MRRSYVDTLFRHRVLCLTPLILAAGLGVAAGVTRPPNYVATSAIFADAPLLDPSTVGTTGGAAPPAGGQQALLTNFLATRSFRLAVGRGAGLQGFEASQPPIMLEKALVTLAAQISSSTPGPNVMVVQVTQPTAAAATRLAQTVVSEFLQLEKDTLSRRTQAQRADMKARADAAARTVDDAQRALATYLAQHPGTADTQTSLLRSAVARALTQYTEVVRSQQDAAGIASPVSDSNLFVIDRPNDAYPKGHRKALALGGIAGLLAGVSMSIGLLIFLVSRDDTVRDLAELRELGLSAATSVPLIPHARRRRAARRAAQLPRARVPVGAAAAGGPSAGGTGPENGSLPAASLEWVPETVLAPCRSLLRRLNTEGPGSVGVVGTTRGDGATTVALAVAVVQRNDYERRTVLVELNFWTPSLAASLGMPAAFGLAEVLRGELSLEEAIQWPDRYLGVLAAGAVDDPMALLSAFRRSPILSELNARGYCVVADLPPLPPAGRGDRVADMFWNVVVVMRAGVTTNAAARDAVASLAATPAVVLTGVEVRRSARPVTVA